MIGRYRFSNRGRGARKPRGFIPAGELEEALAVDLEALQDPEPPSGFYRFPRLRETVLVVGGSHMPTGATGRGPVSVPVSRRTYNLVAGVLAGNHMGVGQ